MKTIFVITVAISAATVTPDYAYDTSFDGKVTMIEPTYVLEGIIFQLDNGAVAVQLEPALLGRLEEAPTRPRAQ